jgi:hypothetical protein
MALLSPKSEVKVLVFRTTALRRFKESIRKVTPAVTTLASDFVGPTLRAMLSTDEERDGLNDRLCVIDASMTSAAINGPVVNVVAGSPAFRIGFNAFLNLEDSRADGACQSYR